MTALTLSMPDSLLAFARGQAEAGGYHTAEDYILELLAQERDRRIERLRADVAAGDADVEQGRVWQWDPDEIMRRVGDLRRRREAGVSPDTA